MAFDAFISYSHAADGRLAPALQRAIQRLAKPWYRTRALRVFRDESALSANPHLWLSIQTALDESDWFVLLASPDAVASEWVNREIAYWLANKLPDRILVVVTDGTWEWERQPNALSGTAVPTALRDAFGDEPRHVDLRWAATETDLDLRNTRFRDVVAQLAAPIHGVGKDELESEDVHQHRHARRLARGAVTVLALLLVIALVTTGFALVQQRRANHNSEIANQRLNVATAERLAVLATAKARSDPALALLLAVEGYRHDDLPATRSALFSVIEANPQLVHVQPASGAAVASMDVTRDGKRFAVGYDDGHVGVGDVATGQFRLSSRPLAPDAIRAIAFAEDGTLFVTLSVNGHIRAWDVATFAPRSPEMQSVNDTATSIVVSRAAGVVVAGSEKKGIIGWRLIDGRSLAVPDTCGFGCDGRVFPSPATPIAVTSDGQRVVAGLPVDEVNPIVVEKSLREGAHDGFLLDTGQLYTGSRAAARVSAVAYSPDGSVVAQGWTDGTIRLYPSTTPAPSSSLRGALCRGNPRLVTSSPIAGNATPRLVASCSFHARRGTASVADLAFSPDGHTLLSGSNDGAVIRWDVTSGRQVGPALFASGGPALSVGWGSMSSSSASSGTFVAATRTGVYKWDTDANALGPLLFRRHGANTTGMTSDVVSQGSSVAVVGANIALYDVTSGPPHKLWTTSPDSAVAGNNLRMAIDPAADLAALTYEEPRGALGFTARVNLIRLSTGKQFGRIGTEVATYGPDVPSQPRPIAFSGDGTLIATSESGVAQVPGDIGLDRKSPSEPNGDQYRFVDDQSANGSVNALAFSPDGHTLAAATSEGLLLWDTATKSADTQVSDSIVNDVAFASDGRLFVATEDGRVFVWDVQHKRQIAEIDPDLGAITRLAVSDGSDLLAATTRTGVTALWSLDTVQPIGSPVSANPEDAAPRDARPAIAFARDGSVLIVSSPGTTRDVLGFWDMRPSAWVDIACRTAGRNLTKAEWQQEVPEQPYRATCPQWAAGT